MQIRKRYVELRHPIKDVVVDFGKYAEAGLTWGEVERSYIELLLASERLKVEAFEKELERRDLVEEAEAPLALRLLKMGRNGLLHLHHSDKGEDDEDTRKMRDQETREILAVYEALREVVQQVQLPT